MRYASQTLTQVTNEDVTEGIFVFPEDLTSIGSGAFRECTGLTTIIIPDSVTTIDNDTFYGCTNLATINIPNSVTAISSNAFSECTRLTNINIPNSITSIGNAVFSGCTRLATINIPNSVTSIGNSTFSGCTSLATIYIPDSIASIGYNTFSGCTNLTTINIPNNVTFIVSYAFHGCTRLTTITIPSSITSIGNEAFMGCSKLNSIIINTEEKSEFERIKKLLPIELREKTMPLSSKALSERNLILEQFNARAYPSTTKPSLPFELSRMIFSYDDWTSELSMTLKKELYNVAIPHPSDTDSLTQYKRSLNELLERHLTCFHLKQYQDKIKKITSNNSSFFSSNAPVANHSILNICNLIDRLIAIILKPDVIPPLSLNEKELLSARASLLKQIPAKTQQQIGIASPPQAPNEEIGRLSKTHSSL